MTGRVFDITSYEFVTNTWAACAEVNRPWHGAKRGLTWDGLVDHHTQRVACSEMRNWAVVSINVWSCLSCANMIGRFHDRNYSTTVGQPYFAPEQTELKYTISMSRVWVVVVIFLFFFPFYRVLTILLYFSSLVWYYFSYKTGPRFEGCGRVLASVTVPPSFF